MKIDGCSIETHLRRLESDINFLESEKSNGHSLNFEQLYNLGRWKIQKKILETLLLTEEKRRLLTCIIELMTKAVAVSGLKGDAFFRIAELHKRVSAAESMEELEIISEVLITFKQSLPEFLQ